MAKYAAAFTKTGADSVAQVAEVLSSATVRRTKWYDLMFANTATPADNLFSYVVRRVTASSTGTALTPRPLDPADAVALSTAEHLITVDHASFATGEELLRVPLNQRASFRWVAAPGGELVGPATSASGLSFGLGAASTSTFAGSVHFEEQ